MHNYSSTLRAWLLAALCSVTALPFSCQKHEADTPHPATQQPASGVSLTQEITAARTIFTTSSYPSQLKEVSLDGKLVHQWQPQWKAAFRVGGALYVPLSLAEQKVGNAKYFLIVQNDVFSLALFVFPSGQSIELVEDSPAFLRTFTGKLCLRRLDTKKTRFFVFDKGQVQARPQSAKPATGAKTQGCVTNTTCYWEGKCNGPFGGQIMYLDMTQGTNGTCESPGDLDCGWGWKVVWTMYGSHSEVDCEPDPDPTNPNPPVYTNTPRMVDGWYKINVVSSGQVLDVNGGYTGNGANVTQWTDNGGSNQIWYVTYLGPGGANGDETYNFTPRSNYLYWQSLGTPPGPSMDQRLGVLPSGVPSYAVGAPAQIWAMSTFSDTAPFNWLLTYAGLVNLNGYHNKYMFSNEYSGLYMNVSGGGGTTAGQLIQWPMSSGPSGLNDQFTFTKLPL